MRRVSGIATISTFLMALMLAGVSPVSAVEGPDGPKSVEEPEKTAPAAVQARPGRGWYLGGRTGFYSAQGDPFIGAEVFVPVAERLSFNPNVEWVFVQDIDGLFTVNADVVYDFSLQGSNFMWAGAGVGVRHFAKGGGWPAENNLALNLLGGMGFGQGNEIMPFVQGKLAISDATEFVLSAGFRF